MEGLTARELAGSLNISVKPIFTAFENMEEVKNAAISMAFEKYHRVYELEQEEEPFKRIVKTYISFAQRAPKLFQLLFMQQQDKSVSFRQYMQSRDEHYSDTVKMISSYYRVSESNAEKLFMNMWIYCHGIATLCATGQSNFSKDEINRLSTTAFMSFSEYLSTHPEA